MPGSHTLAGREALETMAGLDKRAWRKEWTDSKWTRKHPEWDESVPVHRVEGQAGDCILFTCALTARPAERPADSPDAGLPAGKR